MQVENTDKEQITAGAWTYFYVWLALLALLAVTILVARINITSYGVVLNLFIASLKAGLVLAFFMHLKDEGKFLISLFLLTVFALAAIIALTFSDVWYR